MKRVGIKLSTFLAVTGLALCAAATPSQAQPVVAGGNGGFDATTPGSSNALLTSTNTPGWSTSSGYAFVINTSDVTNFNGIGLSGAITPSPLGGNFLAQDSNYLTGATVTMVTGLTVGANYKLSFYQAATQQLGYAGSSNDTWNVSINGAATTAAPTMTIAQQTWSGWTQVNLSFVASAVSETLSFLASSTTGGAPPFALLDGVSVSQTQTVPEPATAMLLLSGFLGLAGLRRARKS